MKCNLWDKIKDNNSSIFRRVLDPVIQKTAFTHDMAMQQSRTLKTIIGKNVEFLDNHQQAIYDFSKKVSWIESFFKWKKIYKWWDESFITKMKKYSLLSYKNSWSKKPVKQWEIFNKFFWDLDVWIKEEIRDTLQIVDDFYWEDAFYLLSKFATNGNARNVDALAWLTQTMLGSVDIEIYRLMRELGNPDLSKDAMKEELFKLLKKEIWDISSDTNLKNLVADLFWEWLYKWSKTFVAVLREARAVTSTLKFSLNAPTNIMYWLNAAIMWTTNYAAKKRWLEWLMESDLLKYLFEDQNFLKSESRITSYDARMLEWMWDSLFNKWLDAFFWKTVDKLSKWKLGWVAKTLVKWGSQTWVDMVIEANVKQLAIAEALSKFWVNVNNADDFLKSITKWIENWTVDKAILTDLRSEARVAYNRFFTNSNLIASSRDRFSRWLPFSFLQHYVVARSAEVMDGFRMLYKDVNSGMFDWMFWRNWIGIWEYLNYNKELKAFIHNMLNWITFWYYLNEYLWDGKDTDEWQKIRSYIKNVNDHFSSMNATVMYRLISALFKYPAEYSEYMEVKWEKASWLDKTTAAVYWVTSELLRSLFREFKVVDMAVWSAWLYSQWFSWDVVSQNVETWLDRAINWMGRFWAIEWFERYWLQKVPDYDDELGYFLMWMDETNKSLDRYNSLMKVEWVEKAIKQWLFNEIFTQIKYSNPIKLLGSTVDVLRMDSSVNSEAKYELMKTHLNRDTILRDLYNGNFNMWVLRTDGILDQKKVNTAFQELVRYDYAYKNSKVDEWWTNEIWWSLNKWKEDMFVEQVLKKIWEEAFLNRINQWWLDIHERWLQKILVMAEQEVKWSSRVILSYMANKDYGSIVSSINKQRSWKTSYSDSSLSKDERTQIQSEIIKKYYWTKAYFAQDSDQESWFKLIEMRLKDIDPEMFSVSTSKQKYFNTLAMMDYVAYTEWKKANPNATFLKNIFWVAGKYIQDEWARVDIVNHTLRTINSLDTNNDVKLMMKSWVLLWNMDFVDNLMKNEEFYKAHQDSIHSFLDIMFDTNDQVNQLWTKLAVNDLDNMWKKQYYSNGWYTNYWNNNKGYPSNKTNDKILNDFKRKVPTRADVPRSYRPSNTWGYWHLSLKAYPNVAKTYWRIEAELWAARSQKLVWWYVRKYPSDFYWQLKFKDRERVKINKVKKPKKYLF